MTTKKKLLYVDDNCPVPEDTDVIVMFLKEAGFDVAVARTGQEAWDRLETDRYDCIILDIMMPLGGLHIPAGVPSYRTGIHIVENLRSRGGRLEGHRDTPIIIFSAIADTDDVKRVRQTLDKKVDRYLEKPIRPKQLLSAVLDVLGVQL